MRTIKFRVWDCNIKKFDKDNNYVIDSNGILLYNYDRNEYGLADCGLPEHNKFTVQQFTGLKDSEGNDIYEGDIVKNDASDWFGVIEISSFSGVQVADKNGKLPIGLYDSKEGVDMDSIYTSYRLVGTKVIGNIMEHKHLLE